MVEYLSLKISVGSCADAENDLGWGGYATPGKFSKGSLTCVKGLTETV